jgi:hypothetical protein
MVDGVAEAEVDVVIVEETVLVVVLLVLMLDDPDEVVALVVVLPEDAAGEYTERRQLAPQLIVVSPAHGMLQSELGMIIVEASVFPQ